MYLLALLLPPIAWVLYNASCLFSNYVKASKLGLPMVACPVSPDNSLWIAFQVTFGSILRYVPLEAISFTRYSRLGWEFHDRYQTHLRLGDVFLLVTPAKNWLNVANPQAVTDIFSRGRDFKRPIWMLGVWM